MFTQTLCFVLCTSLFSSGAGMQNQTQNSTTKSAINQETKEKNDKRRQPGDQNLAPQKTFKPGKQKQNTPSADLSEDGVLAAANPKEQRVNRILQAIDEMLAQTKELSNPIVGVKVRALAGSALWAYQEERAREILAEEYRKIALIKLPEKEDRKTQVFKGREWNQLKRELRIEVLSLISANDPVLADSLLSDEKKEEPEIEKGKKTDMLNTARSLAEKSPEVAARLIRETISTGLNDFLAFSLIALRKSAPVEASMIFNEALLSVRASGDWWDLRKLAPYILPFEEDTMNYLADPQRASDAGALIDCAVEILVQRLEMPQVSNNMPLDLVQRELITWRSLLKVFTDIRPEKVWMVSMRIRALEALLPTPSSNDSAKNKLSPEDKLSKMIAEAEAAIGERRNSLFSRAAFEAANQDNLDLALSLEERLDNKERALVETSFFLSQISTKSLNQGDPDIALTWARRVGMPNVRVNAFARIISAFQSIGRKESSALLLDELLGWLNTYDNNSDKVAGILRYIDILGPDNLERGYAALDKLVMAINSADLNPSPKPFRTYWYPEFHDFRKSLALLSKADFERAFQSVQIVKDKEVFLLMQVALCSEYLKSQKQNSKAKSSR